MAITIIVKGKFDAFKSPINGEIISTQRQLDRHMEEHGVVQAGEFGENDGKKYYERKAKERANIPFNKENTDERRQQLIKAMIAHGNFK